MNVGGIEAGPFPQAGPRGAGTVPGPQTVTVTGRDIAQEAELFRDNLCMFGPGRAHFTYRSLYWTVYGIIWRAVILSGN